jgi:hypothetical protein
MTKSKLPWDVRRQDFSKDGWHTRPTVGYELMFEFLRLSPSYELARKANEEGLTDEDKVRLPADFDQVLNTYKLLGNVQTVLFRSWWLRRGLKVFGNPFTKPKTQLIYRLQTGEEVSASAVAASLADYLRDTRRQEGLTATVLVAIPLGMRRSDVHKQIDLLISGGDEAENEQELKPQIALMGQRLRAKVLFNGIRLLWFRAAKPKWEYWRLGAKARLSKTYSPALDAAATRKTANAIEQVDRDLMTKITFRALMKFENIAENAARGRFPCDAPVSKVDFNYPQLATIISKKNAWEALERERLTKHYATKKTTG